MKIAVGADHRGYAQKQLVLEQFADSPYTLIDVGTDSDERTDFPIYTDKVVQLIKEKEVQIGILLCGSGIGMAIAANRYCDIYAGVVWNETIAQKAKEHNNVNLIVLPSDYITDKEVMPIINAWLDATFIGGRYAERLAMIDKIRSN